MSRIVPEAFQRAKHDVSVALNFVYYHHLSITSFSLYFDDAVLDVALTACQRQQALGDAAGLVQNGYRNAI